MADYTPLIRKESKPHLQPIADDFKLRRDPDFFWPCGTQVYVGRQGSGKTISLVKHLRNTKIRYRKAIVVSNLLINGMKKRIFSNENELKWNVQEIDKETEYIYFQTMEELALVLVHVNNGKLGVIYVIDEIHTYFNALDSKNIPMYVFTEISQQRKQRKLILASSQIFMRLAKPFREQCDSMIVCRTHFNVLTTQTVYDGMTLRQDYDGNLDGNVKKRGWFWHTRKIRESYDTFQKVVSGAEQYEQMNVPTEIKVKGRKSKVTMKSM